MKRSINPDEPPIVSIHLNFDHYSPHIMGEGTEIGVPVYLTYLMVPPGNLNYFYSVRDAQTPGTDIRRGVKTMTDHSNPNFFTDAMTLQLGHMNINVPKLNYIDGDVEIFAKSLAPMDLIEWKAPPRPRSRPDTDADYFYDEDDEERKRREAAKHWSVAKSVFATFKQDTEDVTASCFEYDYRCSRIERILKQASKEEKEKIFNYLRDNYRPV